MIWLKIPCSVNFKNRPEENFKHSLHPIKMDRVEDLVNLGRDFLSKFHETKFNWEQKKVKPGPHLIWEIDSKVKERRKDLKVKIGNQCKETLGKLDVLLEKFQSLFPESLWASM